MTVSSLLSNALSALHVNQEALRVTSNNIANANTPNYARRDIQQQAAVIDGRPAGVEISEIRRIVNSFFAREALTVGSASAQFQTQAEIHGRLQSLFGSPDDGFSLSTRIDEALTAIADLSLEVTSAVRRADTVAEITQMTDTFSELTKQIQRIRSDVDRQASAQVNNLNSLFERVHDINVKIEKQALVGETAHALRDQRDGLVAEIAEIMDIQTSLQPSGAMHIMTTQGFAIVGGIRAELSYTSPGSMSTETIPQSIQATRLNPSTGAPLPPPFAIDSHIHSGELRGLLTMRDNTLPKLAAELGQLAGAVADQFNAVHNNNAAVPAPSAMAGRNTGLLAGDLHAFTGQTSLAVTAADGSLVSRIDFDFDAGTYSVDGGGAVAIGVTMNDLANAINGALGANGTATFANGALTLNAANPANGLSFLEVAGNESSRGGRSLSHFFGLNDLITARRPSHFETGLAGTEAHGFTGGDTVDFTLRHPDGRVATQYTLTIGGATFNDLVTSLNDPMTGLGSFMTFSMSANGELLATPQPGFEGFDLMAGNDITARGGTGVSFTELFGLGTRFEMEQARDMKVVDRVLNDPNQLSLARLDLSGAVAGDIVLTVADNRGALDLEGIANTAVTFAPAGHLGTANATISEYASLVLADISTRASEIDSLREDSAALQEEVFLRKEEVQGVNMDEELANMMVYQQAYNAAARMITTANELFDALLNVV